jgi:DNA-directed RNA polymerase specialized sigma24 family protein
MASPLAGPSPLRDELGRLLSPGSAVHKRMRFVCRRLARLSARAASAEDDLVQDLAVHLVRVFPKFDPQRGTSLEGFLLGVIRLWYPWKARQLRRRAERDAIVGNRDVAWVTTDQILGSRCAFDLVTTRIDLDTVIASLPPDMAALTRLLARCTVSQIAELDSEHRTTTWRKVQRLREYIEENFPDSGSNPRNKTR